jgi:hypothetical protein
MTGTSSTTGLSPAYLALLQSAAQSPAARPAPPQPPAASAGPPAEAPVSGRGRLIDIRV